MEQQTALVIIGIILGVMVILQHIFIIHCMNRNEILGIENERHEEQLKAVHNNNKE